MEYQAAAERNIRWALTKQNANGWFRDCCLSDADTPYTHTIGYVLRGILEAHRFTRRSEYLDAAVRTAEPLLLALRSDGWLAGRLDSEWRPAARWVCLTGNAQLSICWNILGRETGDARFRDAASRALDFVLRTVMTTGPVGIRGGIRGSFPIEGGYGPYTFLNWGPKFTLDAMLQMESAQRADPRVMTGE